jgi:hypothetical protein
LIALRFSPQAVKAATEYDVAPDSALDLEVGSVL